MPVDPLSTDAAYPQDRAIQALSALGQRTRLTAFRLLAKAGEQGLPAGEIAKQLNAPANTVSSHLGVLARAGLIEGARDSRHVVYRIAPAGVRALLDYLVADCCDGRPELCGPTPKGEGCP